MADTLREQFEKWYLSEHPTNIDVKSIARTADYELMITRINWIAWQAATTALLEKLKSEGVMEKAAQRLWESHKADMGPAWYAEEETWKGLSTIAQNEFRKEAQAVIEACILSI